MSRPLVVITVFFDQVIEQNFAPASFASSVSEVLKVQVQELFPPRTLGNRIHDFLEKLEITRF